MQSFCERYLLLALRSHPDETCSVKLFFFFVKLQSQVSVTRVQFFKVSLNKLCKFYYFMSSDMVLSYLYNRQIYRNSSSDFIAINIAQHLRQ